MIPLPRRAFLALCAVTAGTTTFLLLAVAAQYGHGPLVGFARPSAASAASFCPALTDRVSAGAGVDDGDEHGVMAAYVRVEAELTKGSLANVSRNAARIAEAFGEINPDIAASARRLARARDLAAARREFERLTALFSRQPTGPNDEDEAPPVVRPLEV